MVRQRTRKSIEELYGSSKFESSKANQGQNSSGNNVLKTSRNVERDYGYIITANTPYSTGPSNNTTAATATATARRKSARPSTTPKTDKYYGKEEKMLDDVKKEQHNTKQLKTSRGSGDKCPYNSVANMYDNKTYGATMYPERSKDLHSSNEGMSAHQHQHQHHHHNHNHRSARSHDDDKDDDTEEFFELIRHTVESAIGKSISDLLNRNFRELSTKVDRFSTELKNTNALLNKLQTDLNNKVVHYGEENSRHFRYLCMKSEYDKMFYQHQSMIAASTTPEKQSSTCKSAPSSLPPTTSTAATVEGDKLATIPQSCSCRGAIAKTLTPSESKEPHKTLSEDQSLSQKSSEMGMREVLEHIQRFCTQMQLNDLKCDLHNGQNTTTGGSERHKRSSFRHDDCPKVSKQIFDDDDDLDMSSDGMTPRSDEHAQIMNSYGANGVRGCPTTRGGTGGGDA